MVGRLVDSTAFALFPIPAPTAEVRIPMHFLLSGSLAQRAATETALNRTAHGGNSARQTSRPFCLWAGRAMGGIPEAATTHRSNFVAEKFSRSPPPPKCGTVD